MTGAEHALVHTTCPYCGVGCGVRAAGGPGGAAVQGDHSHPANLGRLCSKGAALAETLDDSDRLLHPQVSGERVGWDKALDAVAEGFRDVTERHGAEAVAVYASGQLLTEDYYVANKLVKGALGTANIDTNSRLCMASSVAGHKRAFGGDVVPGSYVDLDDAELVVLAGSNAAWTHPVWFQRLQAVREAEGGPRVIVIDPRRTATAEQADRHLALVPGTDAVLWNGLLVHLVETGAVDEAFMKNHTLGFEAALAAARGVAPSIDAVARACGLSRVAVGAFYAAFAGTEAVVSAYSQGINQAANGTDQVGAIINCHLATGRIGRPGSGPFSLTGQPNAMGGREVGGLANQLAAHMDFHPADRERLARFWGVERVAAEPGPKAVELFDRVASGAIKAVWILGTNPAVSLPDADRVAEALSGCDLVVVSDATADTDTAARADILLPAATWGEKDGTVTNSERRISRQRPFRSAPGEARADWWALAQVGRRLGFPETFAYTSPAVIFREHAALSGLASEGGRAFDISGLADISDEAYERLEPVQWPVNAAYPYGRERLFGDGRFLFPDGRARLVPVAGGGPAGSGAEGELVLNTGRVRDQWHTMTRTGKVARLAEHRPEPFAAFRPEDAAGLGLVDGGLVRLRNDQGKVIVRVRVDEGQAPGTVFVPFHWSAATAAAARVDALVAAVTDPVSGQPASKHARVWAEAVTPAWSGFLLRRRRGTPSAADYWAEVARAECWEYPLAGLTAPADWATWRVEQLGAGGDWQEFSDSGTGRYRAAQLVGDRLEAVLFVGPGTEAGGHDWLAARFAEEALGESERAALLAGGQGGGEWAGPAVCACFGVDAPTLRTAIADGADSVAALGECLGAGTNCGSCIPEIQNLIAEAGDAAVVEEAKS